MRYWAYFAAKLVAVAATFYGLLVLLNWVWPPEPRFFSYVPPRFGYNLGYTLTVLILFLLFTGAMYFVIWDQRYRCRVCLRRLRMPVETGSWSRMLQLYFTGLAVVVFYMRAVYAQARGAGWLDQVARLAAAALIAICGVLLSSLLISPVVPSRR